MFSTETLTVAGVVPERTTAPDDKPVNVIVGVVAPQPPPVPVKL